MCLSTVQVPNKSFSCMLSKVQCANKCFIQTNPTLSSFSCITPHNRIPTVEPLVDPSLSIPAGQRGLPAQANDSQDARVEPLLPKQGQSGLEALQVVDQVFSCAWVPQVHLTLGQPQGFVPPQEELGLVRWPTGGRKIAKFT